MSWQVASFGLLALVLVGGFAWYERSRPPSQTVALVAAMAALAIAGRLALAPIPNVVATTDVVLITGYAVGAGPGFVTGALAGLISNFWLGQGPWTPWQMAGWGLAGVLGAMLARGSGRRLGRLSLAAACGLAGIAYGALLNFSLMVSYGGDVSLTRFGALSARAVPFDLAHAAGNVTLALVAGPALVRMLLRFRERFEVRWSEAPGSPARAATLAALLLALAVAIPVSERPAQAAGGPAAATAWLRAQQGTDGGFGALPGGFESVAMTGWAALGLEAAGQNPLDVAKRGKSAIDYLHANAAAIRGTGDIERTILVLGGAGLGTRHFAGRDLVTELVKRRRRDGSFDGQVNLTAFGALAMQAAGEPGAALSLAWLRKRQNSDGGWGFAPRAASDADSTGAVLQALRAGFAARRGVAFLRGVQASNGGFGLAGAGVNGQSTAWAVQGLVAVGTDPSRVRKGGHSPLDYLASTQAPDGHYRYSRSSNQSPIWVTAEALPAVERKAFPLAAVARPLAASKKVGPVQTTAAHPKSRRRKPDPSPPSRSARRAQDDGGMGSPLRSAGQGTKVSGGTLPRVTSRVKGSNEVLLLAGLGGALVLGAGYFLWRRRRRN